MEAKADVSQRFWQFLAHEDGPTTKQSSLVSDDVFQRKPHHICQSLLRREIKFVRLSKNEATRSIEVLDALLVLPLDSVLLRCHILRFDQDWRSLQPLNLFCIFLL